MIEPANQPSTPDYPCPAGTPPAGVSDALTSNEEAFLLREDEVGDDVRRAMEYFCRFGYPLHEETLAALEASNEHFVVPWSIITEQYIPDWVRQHLIGLEDDRSVP